MDPSGGLPDGRKFQDVRELKQLLLADEKLLARNLAKQLTVYATGAPVRFADREPIEQILERAIRVNCSLPKFERRASFPLT